MSLVIERGIIHVEEGALRVCFPEPSTESTPEYAALVALNVQMAEFLKILRAQPAPQNARADADAAVDSAIGRMQEFFTKQGLPGVGFPPSNGGAS